MIATAADILQRALAGSRLSPEEFLWTLLVVAFALSAVHLVTMFSTRWGDRRVTGKALILSLMLHFTFGLGVVTVAPTPEPSFTDTDEEEEELQFHQVRIESDSPPDPKSDPSAAGEGGGIGATAIWDRVPDVGKAPPQPIVGPTSRVEPAQPDRPSVAAKSTEMKTPDLAPQPETPAEKPTAVKPVEPAKPETVVATPEIEVPKTQPAPKQPAKLAPLNPAAPAAKSVAAPNRASDGVAKGPKPPKIDRATENAIIPKASDPVASIDRMKSPAVQPQATPAAPVPTIEPSPAGKVPASKPQPKSAIGSRLTPRPTTPQMTSSIDRLKPAAPARVGAPTPADYQPVDTPPAGPAPSIERKSAPLIVRRSAGVPSTYRLRKLANRKENAQKFGGTDESERAVESSLAWLAKVQTAAGYWDADAFGAGQVKIDEEGVDRDYAGRDADSGVTALAVLAFLGAGYTHEEGQYAENVSRALRWLAAEQRKDGNLGADAGHFAMMYCHGIATYAMAEAYAMQSDPTSNTMLREPVIRAVQYILDTQNINDGGWRYVKGQKGDMSVFGWQLMALKSAELAGVNVPYDAKVRMVRFLKERALGDRGGLAGYREDLPASSAMTAEALFCRQMLGVKRDSPSSLEASAYLLARLPKRAEFNEYYWYYGTLAMHQYGGDEWNRWNSAVRDLLISEQRRTGEFAGSWDPTGPWARFGGRVYSTALSTLCLEVYYRFLPLYQIGGAPKS